MDSHQSGIIFNGFYANKINFNILKEDEKKVNIPYNIKLHIESIIPDERNGLVSKLKIEVESEVQVIVVEIIGKFTKIGEMPLPIDKFAAINAPAILYPYLREIISNISARSIYPPLLLPPMNLQSAIKYEEPN